MTVQDTRDPEKILRVGRRISLLLIVSGLAPLALLVAGCVLSLISPCTYGVDWGLCGDLNHPAVMIPSLLIMAGMYVIFSWPLAVLGLLLLRRSRRLAAQVAHDRGIGAATD